MTEKQPNCAPRYILQNLESLKEKSTKLEYITNTLERCTITSPTIKQKKRGMSGYNCFVKVSVKKGQPFKQVVKSKAWSTLEDKQKETWKNLANEGCPPRLWEEFS